MIKLDEALNTQITAKDLKDIIESDNIERKFILAVQIIFSTNKAEFGWKLLNSIDLSTIVDENFLFDVLISEKVSRQSQNQVAKFVNFLISIQAQKMAIQKHLTAHNPEKSKDSEKLNIETILQIIKICEERPEDIPSPANLFLLFIKQMACIPSPREPSEIKQFMSQISVIREYFSKATLQNDERIMLLELLYSHLSKTGEQTPTPLMSLGFLLIPETMITQAVEYFFKSLKWNGRKTKESVVASVGLLIYWLRSSSMPVPLDLWIVKTLTVLSENHFYDIVDEVARENVLQATLTLLVPLFQSKIFPVMQALFGLSRNRQELINIVLPRIINLLKQLEQTKSEIFEPFLELICGVLGSFDYTEEKYRDLIKFLALRNRSPSKLIVKSSTGPNNYKFLKNNARVGLENLGNTCYLNSVLQALFMTKQFCREILITERSDRAVNALQRLFALMLFSPRPEQNPASVVSLIRPDDFLPGIQHDSSEFLGSLLDRFHELEKKQIKDEEDWDNERVSASNSEGNRNSFVEVPMDLEDNEPKDKIVDNTANLCQTYIQKIFGGKICTRYLCSTCNGNSINVDAFRDLQLSFPEKSENENCDVQYNVQQLLEFYFTTEELTLRGDNQYQCDNCKILCNGMRCTEILEPPRNLILTLKHFRYDTRHHIRSKLLYKVFHDEIISVNVKGSFKTNSTRNVDYKLYAAIIHSGTSLDSGHYYTIARESDNKWFKFNDSYVTDTSLSELRSLISPNTPYILFYQRLSTASSTIVHPESTSSASSNSLLTNQINDQSFPEIHELPDKIRDIIHEDKLKFETESQLQQNNKITFRVPVRDNFDDNNDPGNGGSFNIDGFSPNRFIY